MPRLPRVQRHSFLCTCCSRHRTNDRQVVGFWQGGDKSVKHLKRLLAYRHISISQQHRRGAPSPCRSPAGISMMSTPFELPQGSKEEAVAAFDEAVLKQEVPTLVYFHAK